MHLVTAKHVAETLEGKIFGVRVNLKVGGSTIIYARNIEWNYHPTDMSADVAVVPFPALKDTELRMLPQEVLLTEKTRKEKDYGIGSEVFIPGLFVYHQGSLRSQPIIRMGNIAMIPEERVVTAKYGPMEAYLIESRSIGGLSGSPVFVRAFTNFAKGEYAYALFGIVHGHYLASTTRAADVSAEDFNNDEAVNVGIAIVTPAQKILDILLSEKLSSHRKAAEEEFQKIESSMKPD